MKKWTLRIVFGLLAALVIGYILARTPDTDAVEMRAKYGGPPSQFVHVESSDQIFHVRDEGPRDAPAIVLLHGSNSDLHTWDEWAEGLKDSYRVVRFDQVGHGLTGPDPNDDYSRATFTEDIRALTHRLGLEQFVLGGNSMGGKHALAFAAAYPERVLGLVLVDSGGPPDLREEKDDGGNLGFTIARTPIINSLAESITPRSLIRTSLEQTVSNKAIVSDAMVDRYWELLRYPGNRRATMKRFSTDYDPLAEGEISGIEVPTLIMWGDEDRLIPLAAGEWLDERMPDSELIVYRGIGHLPQKEAPEETLQDLREWLVKVTSTT
ncbi:alpha/beta fold hydrolase [Erythrobacter sp. THAF29]|uniref:alpha/beta fold hydrolase n=1 Tax=Erythrobacter sp. THAF29 TaxID=2587851 RepID=UPI0012A968C0|nr:alpha/beta hydrolase [Erythrobacter sp. THAF29]QFT77175.1 2-hydroxy-6-oxononadienedioate/2-hydroxy-6-oxononatrienedioate hydrolase [Erythrobacter sp. THAF29]